MSPHFVLGLFAGVPVALVVFALILPKQTASDRIIAGLRADHLACLREERAAQERANRDSLACEGRTIAMQTRWLEERRNARDCHDALSAASAHADRSRR